MANSIAINRASATTSPFATHLTRPLRIMLIVSIAFESSPGTLKRAVALCQPGSLFDDPMILFNDIVEILALAQTTRRGAYPPPSRLPRPPDRPGS
jgi:hypothetical protein